MARSLYYGLVAIMASSLTFALVFFNYGAYWIKDSVDVVAKLASVYDLDHIKCALDAGYCNIN